MFSVAFAQKESLVASYADCFTTLMAVDEPGFRTQLIAALSVVIDRPGVGVHSAFHV